MVELGSNGTHELMYVSDGTTVTLKQGKMVKVVRQPSEPHYFSSDMLNGVCSEKTAINADYNYN